jgi:hypothetical protein
MQRGPGQDPAGQCPIPSLITETEVQSDSPIHLSSSFLPSTAKSSESTHHSSKATHLTTIFIKVTKERLPLFEEKGCTPTFLHPTDGSYASD